MPSFCAVPGVAGGLVIVVREVSRVLCCTQGLTQYASFILPRLHANVSLARSINGGQVLGDSSHCGLEPVSN